MKNVHFGPFPPPIGGISVYIYRLSKLEKKTHFIDSKQIVGTKKFKFWLIKQLFNFKSKNFIIHSHSLSLKLIFYFFSNISVHDFSLVIHARPIIDQYYNSNVFMKFLIRGMLKKAKFIQVVNNQLRDFLMSLKVKHENIIVKHAFLPPPLKEESKILNTYSNELITFLSCRSPIILANAHFLEFYNDQDLYGLDMCIKLLNLLRKDFPNIGFIFSLANKKENYEYYERMKMKISELKLRENFYFLTCQKELWPLFKKIDLFVRPTNTDGDSVSVREAIYFSIPVVASDVVSRPKGCHVFRNRDIEDFYLKCKHVLLSIK